MFEYQTLSFRLVLLCNQEGCESKNLYVFNIFFSFQYKFIKAPTYCCSNEEIVNAVGRVYPFEVSSMALVFSS